jgi:hypothetical protein
MRNLIFVLALVGLISACGKKKEDPGLVASQAVPTPTPTPAPAPTAPPATAPKATPPPTPAPAPVKDGKTGGDPAQGKGQPALPGKGKDSKGAPALNKSSKPGYGEYSGAADDKAGLYYQLRQSGIADERIRAANLEDAKSIESAKLVQHQDSLLVVIGVPEVKIVTQAPAAPAQQTKKADDLDKAAKANGKGSSAAVLAQQVMVADQIVLKAGQTSTGEIHLQALNPLARALKVSGEMKCLDAGESCDTSVVTVYFGDKKNQRQVQILFRTSSFEYHVKYPSPNGDSLYSKFLALFMNSRYAKGPDSQEPNLLRHKEVESFEVINGRSGAKVTMITNEDEMLMFRFALPMQKKGAELKVPVDISVPRGSKYKTALASAISSATLVGNDGRGSFTLSLEMKAFPGATPDSAFDMVIERTQKSIQLD